MPDIAQVVGGNVRRLRGERRQEEVAADLRGFGLTWTQPTIAAVEAGRRQVRIGELPALCAVLECSLGDLLDGDGPVELADGARAELPAARSMVMGNTEDVRYVDLGWQIPQVDAEAIAERGEAEQNAARKLGVSPHTLTATALGLWDRSLTSERDARVAESAPDGASARSLQALRGRVTRRLVNELRDRLKGLG